jgi:hypothetical protein
VSVATVAASGDSEIGSKSHEKCPISSVSIPFDPKFYGQTPKVAKMLLHENHSLSCLTTPGIEGSWFKNKKKVPKNKNHPI